ncbi:MAG: hypothetical protein WCV67_13080 [Victivallaceae bacterium]|jgi:hypothetical protein
MKKYLGIFIIFISSLALLAESPNLAKTPSWNIYNNVYNPPVTTIGADGIISSEGDMSHQIITGAWAPVVVNQSAARPIYVGGDSMAEMVDGERAAWSYGISYSITFADGTRQNNNRIAFNPGSHAWQRTGAILVPGKPVKQVDFHFIFAARLGKAQFCNAIVREVDPALPLDYDGFWGDWKSNKAVGEFFQDLQVKRERETSMAIFVSPDTPPDSAFCYNQLIDAKAGQRVIAKVWVQTAELTPDSQITLAFQGKNAKYAVVAPPVTATAISENTNGQWRELTLDFTIPATGQWASTEHIMPTIGIAKTKGGKVWFADFALEVK